MDEISKILKACIAFKGGILQNELDDEFFKYTGEYIPYLRLGFNSLYQYLGTIEDLVKVRNGEGQLVYYISPEKSAHVTNMAELEQALQRFSLQKDIH